MQTSEEVGSPIPRALLRSPRRVRRKRGTLGPLLLGRILTAPMVIIAAILVAFVIFEPIVAFGIPAQSAKIIRQWPESKARRGMIYYVEYQFDRSGFIGRSQVLPVEYQALHVGQAVKAHLIHLGKVGYSALDRSLRTYALYRSILWFGADFLPGHWLGALPRHLALALAQPLAGMPRQGDLRRNHRQMPSRRRPSANFLHAHLSVPGHGNPALPPHAHSRPALRLFGRAGLGHHPLRPRPPKAKHRLRLLRLYRLVIGPRPQPRMRIRGPRC